MIKDSMNRAFGLVINEIRREALFKKQSLTSEVPIERLVSLAKRFVEGQNGTPSDLTLKDIKQMEPVKVPTVKNISDDEYLKYLKEIAKKWNAKTVDDKVVELTVKYPIE